jgi:hypothetical protein
MIRLKLGLSRKIPSPVKSCFHILGQGDQDQDLKSEQAPLVSLRCVPGRCVPVWSTAHRQRHSDTPLALALETACAVLHTGKLRAL